MSRRYCKGRGRHRCAAIGDIYHPVKRGLLITDAVALIDEWLEWYGQREWFRKLIV